MEQHYNNIKMNINNYSVGDFKSGVNINIMSTPQGSQLNNIYSNKNKNNSHNKIKRNISEIAKLNYNNENLYANIFNRNNNNNNNQIIQLDHKLIEATTEDNEHTLRELKKGLKGLGWFSSQFSRFPQEIYVYFSKPVFINQINLVIHEKFIPSKIKFYTFFPENGNEIILNYRKVHYKYIGFIKIDSNERTQFKAKESRKVYLNEKSVFLKIELGENYQNEFNTFNQVGLMNLEFLGRYLPPFVNNLKKKKLIKKHALSKENSNIISDKQLENICGQDLKELKETMNYNIKTENYTECKQIKIKMEKVKLYGKQIYDLENQKKIAIKNEDFDQAFEIKNTVDKMKENMKKIINSNINKNFLDIVNINNKESNNNNNELNYNHNINESSITDDNNKNNYFNQTNTKYLLNTNYSNTHYQKTKTNEENYLSYDDTIIPAVLRKITNESKIEEDESGDAEKGELEEISDSLLKEYKLIVDVIGEINIRKIFSKQIIWKKEGLNYLLKNID